MKQTKNNSNFFINKSGVKYTDRELIKKIGLTHAGAKDRIKRANALATEGQWDQAEKLLNRKRQEKINHNRDGLTLKQKKILQEIQINQKQLALLNKYYPT